MAGGKAVGEVSKAKFTFTGDAPRQETHLSRGGYCVSRVCDRVQSHMRRNTQLWASVEMNALVGNRRKL